MNLFGLMNVSGSALEAERIRAEVVAANMANANTTRTATGGPYLRQEVVFASDAPDGNSFAAQMMNQPQAQGSMAEGNFGALPDATSDGMDAMNGMNAMNVAMGGGMAEPQVGGVRVAAVVTEKNAVLKRYDPNNPDADKQGYVSYPDINPITEMVDLMSATRSYGLNTSAVQATKSMISDSIDILKP
ncbi:MAG: flagellar basal body rod protein FlgC [Acidobacteriaceae bacterium]